MWLKYRHYDALTLEVLLNAKNAKKTKFTGGKNAKINEKMAPSFPLLTLLFPKR
jgi:hypothetical protein